MNDVKIRVSQVTVPTYEIGEPEKNPIFLEKRVYQGSSGKVYPYPTIEKISDEKVDKEYTAVYLENEYLQVMVLPELGGRIQRAYDKTNGYDFVYYNHVIKPALVGLTGPWISGGIEFNWPQHHRPTTYLPTDYTIEENEDGSKSVLIHDVDQINGTKGIAKYTLYPGKAYIEITGQLYNRTSLPQTFLWWANPAVPVNENTQSIFPPDVHGVMDHGKRDVSRFPIATGVYYKHDYSEGVDISRYKNIPVPTSYMAEKSKYDFVGGYDYGREAGILHVADHHYSPGKKQWTWGCGAFGQAWDRNLTDEDGPYVELMTGVYTDNQPDFTWLKPFEEKTFKQYFMPYKAVGQVKNATTEAAVHFSNDDDVLQLVVYATSVYEQADIVLTYDGTEIFREQAKISPMDIYRRSLPMAELNMTGNWSEDKLRIEVLSKGKCLVAYQPEPMSMPKMPEPAQAAKEPAEIITTEELYLTGLHLEQYRHATYLPDPYYLEGLKRDPRDIRINCAYGALLMRRGKFSQAEQYIRKALERLTYRNPNPYNSEAYYLLGLVLFYQDRCEEAYDAFFKATWSNEQQEMSFYYLAALDARANRYDMALTHINKALVKNAHNIKGRGLKAYILRKLGKKKAAATFITENLLLDPFDYVSGNEQVILLDEERETRAALNVRMRDFPDNYLMSARDYAEFGAYEEAIHLLNQCTGENPMLYYYKAYYRGKLGEDGESIIRQAEKCPPDYCFPNKLEDIAVLKYAAATDDGICAKYYLGNLYYDKMRWEDAVSLWEASVQADPSFPTVHRNLSLAYYNKMKNPQLAKAAMEKAFALNPEDVRILLELDQLYKKLGMSFADRRKNLEDHQGLIDQRDDLYIEYITLLNMTGEPEKAYQCIMGHKFHPWEGGEGKVTTQYTLALLAMARKAMKRSGKWDDCDEASDEAAQELLHLAKSYLQQALIYPENLGEGKLEGTKDNHVYYHLGLVLGALGDKTEADACFAQAAVGSDEVAGAMYYNDQPADMILYQGLANLKLGRTSQAKSRFYRLIDYGEQHVDDQVKIEYFAVSLPDFLIFEDDYTVKNKAHCYYLMALGNIGLNHMDKAKGFLEQINRLEPSHMMSRVYTEMIS